MFASLDVVLKYSLSHPFHLMCLALPKLILFPG